MTIFYYSATGNSASVAMLLSGIFKTPMIAMQEVITADDPKQYLKDDTEIILVSPVHAWNVSQVVRIFLEFLIKQNYHCRRIYNVFTCGDDCGRANLMIQKLAKPIVTIHTYSFSVQMPNTYILLPGFDVDSEEVELKKLSALKERIQRIATAIKDCSDIKELYTAGRFAWLKTHILGQFFWKYMVKQQKFHATGTCNGCGLCQLLCPIGCIYLDVMRRPVWKSRCLQCLACLHYCPQRAINWGNQTQTKGRYHNPLVDISKKI